MINDILVVLAIITGAIYFFSPLILFYNYYKNKFKNWYCLPGMQLFANLFNSLFWIVWCLNRNTYDLKFLLVNYIGIGISTILLFYYWHAAFKIRFREHFIHLFSIWNVLFQIGWVLILIFKDAKDTIASIVNIFMYASVYKNIIYSYRNNVKEVLPIIESCIAIVNTTLWVLVGIFNRSNEEEQKKQKIALFIVIPNGVSLIFLIIGFIVTIYLKIRVVETHNNNRISMSILNSTFKPN